MIREGVVLSALILFQVHVTSAIGQCSTACKRRTLDGFISRAPANASYPSHLLEPVSGLPGLLGNPPALIHFHLSFSLCCCKVFLFLERALETF